MLEFRASFSLLARILVYVFLTRVVIALVPMRSSTLLEAFKFEISMYITYTIAVRIRDREILTLTYS